MERLHRLAITGEEEFATESWREIQFRLGVVAGAAGLPPSFGRSRVVFVPSLLRGWHTLSLRPSLSGTEQLVSGIPKPVPFRRVFPALETGDKASV
jgi:hypothetical protein